MEVEVEEDEVEVVLMTNSEGAQGGLTNPPLGNQSTPIPQTDLTDQLDLTDLDLTDSTDYRPTSVLVDSNPFQIPHIINNLDGIPVPFRHLHCIDEWKKYAEPWVLPWLEHGIPLPWRGVPYTPPPRPQDDRLRSIIAEYLAKGILEEATDDQQAIQHIFAVPKSSRGYRAVTDFRPANEVQDDPPHFKMTTVQSVRDTLFQGAWMCKIDMEDAYNHLWVDDMAAAMLGISFDGKTYRWRGMGFGLKWAPYLFTKVVRESLRELRLRGAEILDYLDDLMIMSVDDERDDTPPDSPGVADKLDEVSSTADTAARVDRILVGHNNNEGVHSGTQATGDSENHQEDGSTHDSILSRPGQVVGPCRLDRDSMQAADVVLQRESCPTPQDEESIGLVREGPPVDSSPTGDEAVGKEFGIGTLRTTRRPR